MKLSNRFILLPRNRRTAIPLGSFSSRQRTTLISNWRQDRKEVSFRIMSLLSVMCSFRVEGEMAVQSIADSKLAFLSWRYKSTIYTDKLPSPRRGKNNHSH